MSCLQLADLFLTLRPPHSPKVSSPTSSGLLKNPSVVAVGLCDTKRCASPKDAPLLPPTQPQPPLLPHMSPCLKSGPTTCRFGRNQIVLPLSICTCCSFYCNVLCHSSSSFKCQFCRHFLLWSAFLLSHLQAELSTSPRPHGALLYAASPLCGQRSVFLPWTGNLSRENTVCTCICPGSRTV